MWIGANVGWGGAGGIPYWGCKSNLCGGGSGRGRCVQFNWGGSGANVDWGECGLGPCVIVGRIPYWGCKSNLCGADLEGGGASNLTGEDRGRMWIGAVSPASPKTTRAGIAAWRICRYLTWTQSVADDAN